MKEFNIEDQPKIRSGMSAPDSYFEALSNNISEKLNNPEPKVIPLYRKPVIWLSAVASMTIIALAVWPTKQSTVQASEAMILEEYISDHTNIHDEDIIAVIEQTDISQIQIDLALDPDLIEESLSENPNIEIYITQ